MLTYFLQYVKVLNVANKSTNKEVKKVTDTFRLREKILNSGLKYKYIAEQMGLTRYGLMRKINNQYEFKSSEIAILCNILHIDSLDEKEKIFFAQKVENKSTNSKVNK